MNKKTAAVIAELIPVTAAPVYYYLVLFGNNSALTRSVIRIAILLAFSGFGFFFLGRRLAGEDRTVRILGILDWLATLSVVVFYAVAIFSFGL